MYKNFLRSSFDNDTMVLSNYFMEHGIILQIIYF